MLKQAVQLNRNKSQFKDSLEKKVDLIHRRLSQRIVKPFECSICHYATKRIGDYNKHVKAVHCKERPYKCEICLCCFKLTGSLTGHKKNVHENEKPLECSFCHYATKKNGDYNKHIKRLSQFPLVNS